MILKYTVEAESSGKTIKYILREKLMFSQNLIRKLKRQNGIFCNKKPVFVNAIVKENDIVEANINFEEKSEGVIPEDIPIDIIYEDEVLIALNKPAGIIVHPTRNHLNGTLGNALSYHFHKKGISSKIRPVMRLDRDTSGIIIFAKNSFAQDFMTKQMRDNLFYREYIGIVHGLVDKPNGTIDLPIARKSCSTIERCILPSGYPSITHYKVIEHLKNATFLRFILETGRTHQIRVHCQALGHPIYGDTLYNNAPTILENQAIFPQNQSTITSKDSTAKDSVLINRQALHSSKVVFIHPINKKPLELAAPMPYDIENLMEILRK